MEWSTSTGRVGYWCCCCCCWCWLLQRCLIIPEPCLWHPPFSAAATAAAKGPGNWGDRPLWTGCLTIPLPPLLCIITAGRSMGSEGEGVKVEWAGGQPDSQHPVIAAWPLLAEADACCCCCCCCPADWRIEISVPRVGRALSSHSVNCCGLGGLVMQSNFGKKPIKTVFTHGALY